MSDQSVKVAHGDPLLTNAEGQVQFLTDASAMTVIEINGAQVWSGVAGSLQKEELFSQTSLGFVRVT